MAGISLEDFGKAKLSTDSVNSRYAFTDVDMDMHQEVTKTVAKNWGVSASYTEGKDLAVIHDVDALANSIFYILATTPGQRPLVPNFGLDLRQYISKQMTQDTAARIRDDIANAIATFEPRVSITRIDVVPNEEEHEYDVAVHVTVPFFRNRRMTVFGKVTTTGTFKRIVK